MKKILTLFLVLIIFMSACNKTKASSYFSDIDNAILSYSEYLSYKKSIDKITDKEQRKIALLQSEAIGEIDIVKSDYESLSEDEQKIFVEYIHDHYSPTYNPLEEWLINQDGTYQELVNAIDNGSINE